MSMLMLEQKHRTRFGIHGQLQISILDFATSARAAMFFGSICRVSMISGKFVNRF